ncbi:MAG: hypothetical protein KH009_03425 [Clostridiales bacterium]|nr:hypothetical protein [Clostridiales bacterium]
MATSKIQTGLRLNEPLYEKLKVISSSEQRSLNNLIEYIVQKYVDEYEQINGPVRVPDER